MPKRATNKPQTKKKQKTLVVADEAEIRRRAYDLYLKRGTAPGNPNEDWLEAEREIMGRKRGK